MVKNEHIIKESATLIEAIAKLNALSGRVMTLFVTDENGILEGSLTDGDIRRALLRGVTLPSPVSEAMNRNCRRYSDSEPGLISEYRELGIRLLPVVDAAGRITELIDLSVTRAKLPLRAVLMAGGFGERLRPMTLHTPKPLLEIEGKAIIDYNIELLAEVGVTDITVTTRYLAEKIEAHFATPVAGVTVRTVRETDPLGTIGAVALTDIPDSGDTIVMNSDLLTTIRFEEMYAHHVSTGADVTVAAIPYTVSVPYAILGTKGEQVVSLEEKPTYSYFANAGIYIFRNRVLKTLRKNQRKDATTLIEEAIGRRERISYFPINGTWIDIGTPADFANAAEMMRQKKH